MSDQDEDGIVSPWVIKSVLKQGGIEPDDIFAARLRRSENEKLDDLNALAKSNPDALVNEFIKLRYIVAYMYQVAGIHDCDELILDVLSDPEEATEEQIAAMLPYMSTDAEDAKRWRFRKNFLADGGAILFSANGCQLRYSDGQTLIAGATEEDAIDLAIRAEEL